MVIHQRDRPAGVAGDQRRHDFPVLAHRAIRRVRPAVERQDQGAAIAEFGDVAAEHRASGHLGEQQVELRGEPDRGRLRAAARPLLTGDMVRERGLLLGAQAAGEPLNHEALQADAHVEGVARLFPARARHHGDAVAAQLDQPLARELNERLARDGAADAEPLAERVLGQPVAGRQGPLHDGPAKGSADRSNTVGRGARLALSHRRRTSCCGARALPTETPHRFRGTRRRRFMAWAPRHGLSAPAHCPAHGPAYGTGSRQMHD